MRGLAAAAVCIFHWEHIAFGTPNAAQVFRFGLLGVELFFLISGFVILMVAERRPPVPVFLLARAVRLYPAYLVSVALTAVYVLGFGRYGLGTVLVNATMLQSFLDVPNITNPYWTLAFEICFYAAVAAVLRAGALDRIEAICLGWLALAFLYRLALPGCMSFDPERPLAQLAYIVVAPQFAPFFVLGMMIHRAQRGLKPLGVLATVAAVLLTFAGRGDFASIPGGAYAGFTCLAGASLWAAARLRAPAPALAIPAWLGIVSYPLYLVHCTIANLCVATAARAGIAAPAAVAVSVPLAIGFAAVLHHLVERPAMAASRSLLQRYEARAIEGAAQTSEASALAL